MTKTSIVILIKKKDALRRLFIFIKIEKEQAFLKEDLLFF